MVFWLDSIFHKKVGHRADGNSSLPPPFRGTFRCRQDHGKKMAADNRMQERSIGFQFGFEGTFNDRAETDTKRSENILLIARMEKREPLFIA